jgi:redox-sensitive bicupin YhaK (pirin superfamily)
MYHLLLKTGGTMSIRPVKKLIKSKPTLEGAGVHLRRAFGFGNTSDFDPFLLLDDFRNDVPEDYLTGFPWHPHRGIETITYVLAGTVEHGDSMGNRGAIAAGDVQWMTAGSGIIHQEMPKGDREGVLSGFQLWANLPASHKMMDPRYRGAESAEIPEVSLDGGATAKVVAGRVGEVQGPVRDVVTDPTYLDVTLPAGAELSYPVETGHTALAYVIEGRGYFDDRRDPYAFEAEGENYFDLARDCLIGSEHLVVFGPGDRLAIATGDDRVRFLLFTGKPIGEPIAWYGPIVMNTQSELQQAVSELRAGTFIKD